MRNYLPIAILFLLFYSCTGSPDQLTVSQIKCSGVENPVGTGMIPDFSWILESGAYAKSQSAYQIIVNTDNEVRKNAELWDSGKTISEKSAWISYQGPPLESGKEYTWKVRVWDEDDNPSEWSAAGFFVTGLPDKKDWNGAKWIGYEDIPDSLLLVPGVHGSGDHLGEIAKKRTIVPYFRKEFSAGKKIIKAFVFVSGLGQYELYLNGEKIGDRFLSPGWSDYRKTCFYNTFDVTEDLKNGMNCVAAIVGNGFYNINRERYRKFVIAYGAPKMIIKA
jgi:alpha-L-rhamnosidase